MDWLKSNATTTEQGFLCLSCGIHYTHKTSLKRHYRDQHQATTTRYLCPICKTVSKNLNSFQNHIYRLHKELKGLDSQVCVMPPE